VKIIILLAETIEETIEEGRKRGGEEERERESRDGRISVISVWFTIFIRHS
jgi:hypothetical protein